MQIQSNRLSNTRGTDEGQYPTREEGLISQTSPQISDPTCKSTTCIHRGCHLDVRSRYPVQVAVLLPEAALQARSVCRCPSQPLLRVRLALPVHEIVHPRDPSLPHAPLLHVHHIAPNHAVPLQARWTRSSLPGLRRSPSECAGTRRNCRLSSVVLPGHVLGACASSTQSSVYSHLNLLHVFAGALAHGHAPQPNSLFCQPHGPHAHSLEPRDCLQVPAVAPLRERGSRQPLLPSARCAAATSSPWHVRNTQRDGCRGVRRGRAAGGQERAVLSPWPCLPLSRRQREALGA